MNNTTELIPQDASATMPHEPAPAASPGCSGWLSLVLAALLIAVSCVSFGVYYETNDDPVMGQIASGLNANGQPNCRLLYTHCVIGQLLVTLYQAWPGWDWYATYLMTAHVLAHAGVIWLCTRAWPGSLGGPVFSAWFAIVELTFLTPLQFTTTSVLCGVSGLGLTLYSLGEVALNPARSTASLLRTGSWWSGVGLLLLSCAIRLNSLQLVLVLAGPAVVYMWLTRAIDRRWFAGGFLTLLVLGLGFGSLVSSDFLMYRRSPEWSHYLDHVLQPIAKLNNEERLNFFPTNPRFKSPEAQQRMRDKLASAGWSTNDLQLVQAWFYDDPEVFSPESLHGVVNVLTPWTDREKAEVIPRAVFQPLATFTHLIIALAAMWTIYLALQGRRPGAGLFCVLLLMLCANCLMAFLKTFQKLPDRVFEPLALAPLFGLLWWSAADHCRRAVVLSSWRSQLTTLLAAMTVMGGMALALRNPEGPSIRADYRKLQQELQQAQLSPSLKYVIWHPDMFDLLPPFADVSQFRNWHWVFLDGHQADPRYLQVLQAWGWNDASSGLRTDPEARLISDPRMVRLLNIYLAEHYPGHALVPEWRGEVFSVYRVQQTDSRQPIADQ